MLIQSGSYSGHLTSDQLFVHRFFWRKKTSDQKKMVLKHKSSEKGCTLTFSFHFIHSFIHFRMDFSRCRYFYRHHEKQHHLFFLMCLHEKHRKKRMCFDFLSKIYSHYYSFQHVLSIILIGAQFKLFVHVKWTHGAIWTKKSFINTWERSMCAKMKTKKPEEIVSFIFTFYDCTLS